VLRWRGTRKGRRSSCSPKLSDYDKLYFATFAGDVPGPIQHCRGRVAIIIAERPRRLAAESIVGEDGARTQRLSLERELGRQLSAGLPMWLRPDGFLSSGRRWRLFLVAKSVGIGR